MDSKNQKTQKFGIFTKNAQYSSKMLTYTVVISNSDCITNTPQWKTACETWKFVEALEIL